MSVKGAGIYNFTQKDMPEKLFHQSHLLQKLGSNLYFPHTQKPFRRVPLLIYSPSPPRVLTPSQSPPHTRAVASAHHISEHRTSTPLFPVSPRVFPPSPATLAPFFSPFSSRYPFDTHSREGVSKATEQGQRQNQLGRRRRTALCRVRDIQTVW